jgi:hypothetical protein
VGPVGSQPGLAEVGSHHRVNATPREPAFVVPRRASPNPPELPAARFAVAATLPERCEPRASSCCLKASDSRRREATSASADVAPSAHLRSRVGVVYRALSSELHRRAVQNAAVGAPPSRRCGTRWVAGPPRLSPIRCTRDREHRKRHTRRDRDGVGIPGPRRTRSEGPHGGRPGHRLHDPMWSATRPGST